MQYKPGDCLESTGQVIQRVIGQDSHTVVVITTDKNVRYEFPPRGSETPPDFLPVIDTLSEISSLGRQVLKPGHRDDFRSDMAEALWASFQTPEAGDRLAAFSDIRHRLQARWQSLATIAYFEGAIPILLLSLIPLVYDVLVHRPAQALSTAAAGGAAGVLLSVAERIRRVEVGDFSPLWQWSLEGAFRGLLGVVSGIIMVALIDFDLFLGFAKGRIEGIFLAGVTAGFAERLVPTLLIRLTHSSTASRKSRI
jgi:hypothetical protein